MTTTLDARLQDIANKALERGLRAYDKRHGWRRATRNVVDEGHSIEGYKDERWSRPIAVGDIVPAVVLTAPYHERDARRLGLPVHTPPADTWEDWVEKFGIDPDRVRGMESEDLAWLRAGEGDGHFHGPGDWPFGIQAFAGREDNDLILWLPSIGAIVTGDSLSDFGDGLDIQLGGRKHVTRDDVARRLRPLLDLPIELVLPAHGEPTDRAALERLLS